MYVTINWETKQADVGVRDITTAGWVGFHFATKNPDLIEAGWYLCYFQSFTTVTEAPYTVYVRGPVELGQIIREGPPCDHSCPRHEAVE